MQVLCRSYAGFPQGTSWGTSHRPDTCQWGASSLSGTHGRIFTLPMPSHFNIRVYGIYIKDHHLLVNEEFIRGRRVIKLPGGGLELGEGTLDGLRREWQEELNLEIEVLSHYYTTDFYQQSAFDDSQVVSIYYMVSAANDAVIQNIQPNERTYWLPLSSLTKNTFTLPIDKVVGTMLLSTYKL